MSALGMIGVALSVVLGAAVLAVAGALAIVWLLAPEGDHSACDCHPRHGR